jgi:site-specific DNA-cytosine methylase
MNPYGNTKHGHHGSLTYSRWKAMRQRSAKQHGPYATVECCARWESFDAFLADMGECPESHTLDRIDNQRGYEPGNCRWATMADQNANRSSVVLLTPRELYRAQGFPEDYRIERGAAGEPISKTAQVRMCGNSVCPPLARAVVKANYSEQQAMQEAA